MSRVESNIANVSHAPKPFFRATLKSGFAHSEGTPSCLLGRRVPLGAGLNDDGVFLEWVWDGQRLIVKNDRYGLYPLFYCAKADSISISPALENVVRSNSSRQLDFPALAIFFRMGHFTGSDTPFEDVRFMPPNSTLTWENGRLDIQQHREGAFPSTTLSPTFDDAVEVYGELFSLAISRRLPDDEHFMVPLSGGRDSRHILLELAKQGARPAACATLRFRPPSTDEDMRVARLLAERLQIPHIEIDKPASFFDAELKEIHMTNYCGGGHGWILPLASRLVGEFSTVYDGLAGEVLSAGFMLDSRKTELFRQEAWPELARLILGESAVEPVLRSVFTDDFCSRIHFNDAVGRLVPELRRHAGLPNPLLSFIFANRTRRCVASIPFAILHQIPVVHVPYLDHAIFDFLSALDPSMMEGGRLHDETIRRAYPEHADIPYEDKSVKATMSAKDRDYYRAARRAFFFYLHQAPASSTILVRKKHLYARLGTDLMIGKGGAPWYMRPALQSIELERLRLGC